ncbi:hypothetical protein HK405_001074, partial [Cladochytrium tenue]
PKPPPPPPQLQQRQQQQPALPAPPAAAAAPLVVLDELPSSAAAIAAKDRDQMDGYIAELARRRDVEAILKRVKQIVNSVATMSTELRSSVGPQPVSSPKEVTDGAACDGTGGGGGGEGGNRGATAPPTVETIIAVMNELVESSLALETNWEDWTALKDIDVIRRKRMRIAVDEPSEVRPPVRRRTSKKDSDAGPGLCHGCHATETPEWRRGPGGSRTLCN